MKKYLFLGYPFLCFLSLYIPTLLIGAIFRETLHIPLIIVQSFCDIAICLVYYTGRRRKDSIKDPVSLKMILIWGGIGLSVQAIILFGLCSKALLSLHWTYYVFELIWSFFWVALCEELLFREFLMSRFKRLHTPVWISLVVSALLFALLHKNTSLFVFIQRFLLGVVFGWIYYRMNNITLVVVVHWIFDVVLSVLQKAEVAISAVYSMEHLGLIMVLCALSVLGIIVAYWINKSKFAV